MDNTKMQKRILITGAGGFIGGHLVADLIRQGHFVRAVDKKPLSEWHQLHLAVNSEYIPSLDLTRFENCVDAVYDMDEVYNLAADMGGMGFIENNKAACMLSVLINTHLLMAAKTYGVKRYFFSSSACAYAGDKQITCDVLPLRESDAYPASPEDGYGWEKLFSERMCRHFREDYGLETRIARFHNVYGPFGTYRGGREKAPAALCRKVAEAVLDNKDSIEIWGDGLQTRSFMYIDDCIYGTQLIMNGPYSYPINLGSNDLVSINKLAEWISWIADRTLRLEHISGPTGVRGRNSDNSLIQARFGWEPRYPLRVGLTKTYQWILEQIKLERASSSSENPLGRYSIGN